MIVIESFSIRKEISQPGRNLEGGSVIPPQYFILSPYVVSGLENSKRQILPQGKYSAEHFTWGGESKVVDNPSDQGCSSDVTLDPLDGIKI